MTDSAQIDPEENVLQLLKEQDPNAASLLLEVFGDRIYGLSLRILSSVEDAEEAVQETFLRIWNKWPTFKGNSKFSSWVYRIAANCAYMKLRKGRRRSREISIEDIARDVTGLLDTDAEDPDMGRTFKRILAPDEVLQNKELMVQIDRAVNSLPDGSRTAYILKDVEGMPLKDIAAAMGLSDAAVKSRIHRARLEVRQMLSDIIEEKNSPENK